MAKKSTMAKQDTTESKSSNGKAGEPDLSFIPIWSKKLGKSAEELKKRLQEIVDSLMEKHAEGWSEEKLYATARRRLYSDFKSEFRSSATYWLICPLYKSEPNDFGFKKWKAAMDLYSTNPKEALAKKFVKVDRDAKGKVMQVVPLDTKLKTNAGKPNKHLGKELPEHDWIQTVGGCAIPLSAAEKGEMNSLRPMEMTNSRQLADPESKLFLGSGFETGKWYKVKCTNATKEDNTESWQLNGTTVSKWQAYELEFDNAEISKIFEQFYVPLNELTEYHTSYAEENKEGTKEYNNRIVVTEGEVVDIVLSADGQQSHRLLLDDESLGLTDDDGEIIESITCWIDSTMNIEFGKYSRVMVFGRTSRGLKKDMDTNELTEDWNNVSITVLGILVLDLVEPELDAEDDIKQAGSTDEYDADENGNVEIPDINADDPAPEGEKAEGEDEQGTDDIEGTEPEGEESTEPEEEPAETKSDATKIIKHSKKTSGKTEKW